MGLFSLKSPIFGVWLHIVDELRIFDDTSGETGNVDWL